MLFNAAEYNSQVLLEDGQMAPGAINNYADKVSGRVWNIKMLAKQMGPDDFDTVWCQIEEAIAYTACAAVAQLHAHQVQTHHDDHNNTFEVGPFHVPYGYL